jgi:hypothetical protein
MDFNELSKMLSIRLNLELHSNEIDENDIQE